MVFFFLRMRLLASPFGLAIIIFFHNFKYFHQSSVINIRKEQATRFQCCTYSRSNLPQTRGKQSDFFQFFKSKYRLYSFIFLEIKNTQQKAESYFFSLFFKPSGILKYYKLQPQYQKNKKVSPIAPLSPTILETQLSIIKILEQK